MSDVSTETGRPAKKKWTLTLGPAVIISMFMSLAIIFATIAIAITNTNKRSQTTTEEVVLVAQCTFLFQAYRAQYTQTLPTTGENPDGLDPLGGLRPPGLKEIHLEPCQKYLTPINRARLSRALSMPTTGILP